MTDQGAPTPTPWTLAPNGIDIIGGVTREEDRPIMGKLFVARCDSSAAYRSDAERLANARLIVRAVNSHDKLVAACKAAMSFLDAEVAYGPEKPVFAQIEKAIAEAGS